MGHFNGSNNLIIREELQISAVIPTYNRGHLIARAIESMLNQRFQPAEIIVVDDGSTDDTRKRVEIFGDRVQYIYQKNAGSAAARNLGIRRAKSEWVALLDSDDMWLETHLDRVVQAIRATHGQANYYFADTIEPPDKGGRSLWEFLAFDIDSDYEFVPDGTNWVMTPRRQPMMLQSSVFKRTAVLQSGGFLETLRYRDDTHLFLKLGIRQPVCAVAGCGVRMTSDDDPKNRLTLNFNDRRRGHWMHVLMYEDLLSGAVPLSAKLRRELKQRLATAYRAMARCSASRRYRGASGRGRDTPSRSSPRPVRRT